MQAMPYVSIGHARLEILIEFLRTADLSRYNDNGYSREELICQLCSVANNNWNRFEKQKREQTYTHLFIWEEQDARDFWSDICSDFDDYLIKYYRRDLDEQFFKIHLPFSDGD